MNRARRVKGDWYEHPRYYDIVYDVDTGREADFLQAVHRLHGRSRGRKALEPACGGGRLVRAMVRRGYRVTGLDLQPAMLDYARRRLRHGRDNARWVEADMAYFDVGRGFDLAYCLLSSFQYLASEQSAHHHLQNVARALKPGGVYVLGLHLADYGDGRVRRERWQGSRRGVHVTCNLQSWAADRATRTQRMRSRLLVRGPEGIERLETVWSFRTYDDHQLRRLLAATPQLELAAVYDYELRLDRTHDLADDRLDTILVLRRAGPRQRQPGARPGGR